MIHALIFDVDGVLLDSVDFHYKSWKRALQQEEIDLSFDQYLEKLNGFSREQGIKNVLPDASPEKLNHLFNVKQAFFEELLDSENLEPIPEVSKTLKKLGKRFLLAAASSSKNAPALLKKTGLDTHLKVIISGHDIKKSKPDPEIFLLAAERLGISPEHCIVIEDAEAGIQAAHNGGMRSIGFDRSSDTKLKQTAQHFITSFGEILAVLDDLQ